LEYSEWCLVFYLIALKGLLCYCLEGKGTKVEAGRIVGELLSQHRRADYSLEQVGSYGYNEKYCILHILCRKYQKDLLIQQILGIREKRIENISKVSELSD
jgi:hypothetical protein